LAGFEVTPVGRFSTDPRGTAKGIDQLTFHPTGKTAVNKAHDLNRNVVHDFIWNYKQ